MVKVLDEFDRSFEPMEKGHSYTQELFYAAFDGVEVRITTEYPRDGKIHIDVSGLDGKNLCVRIPGWCDDYCFSDFCDVKEGYAVFSTGSGSMSLDIEYKMRPKLILANPAVRADAGKAALSFGPVIYCMEGIDNPCELYNIVIDTTAEPAVEYDERLGMNKIRLSARTQNVVPDLYFECGQETYSETNVTLIPYCTFANREESDMRVWFRYR